MEVERKFLVVDVPDRAGLESSEIQQGYLATETGDHGAEVRIRQRDDAFVLTVKCGHGLTRSEEEVPLTREQFEVLWRLTAGSQISKTRYLLPADSGVIELDVYAEALSGLVVAEVEFPNEVAARAFKPPEWFGRELTGDPGYSNASLATRGLPS